MLSLDQSASNNFKYSYKMTMLTSFLNKGKIILGHILYLHNEIGHKTIF